MNPLATVAEIAAAVPSGCKLALPVDYAGVPMAMTRPLIRCGPRDLHLVCVPTAGLQLDMLIGAGLVRTVETSAVSLGEAGGAPCFMRAVSRGEIELRDSTCPAIHAGLMAVQKGVPFLTLRGLIGTDVLKNRADWRVIDNPFSTQPDPVVAIPAINPDVAIFHAPMADREGNVWIGRRRELASMAYASRHTYVTVERIVERNLLSDEIIAAGVLPALYVEARGAGTSRRLALRLVGRVPARHGRADSLCRASTQYRGFSLIPDGQGQTRDGAMTPATSRESLIARIAVLLEGVRHVAVGASSPIPAAAAMMLRARQQSAGIRALKLLLLGSVKHNFFTNGSAGLFDCAAQGRVDAFFLGGGQIDGQGNINLVDAGACPQSKCLGPARSVRASCTLWCRGSSCFARSTPGVSSLKKSTSSARPASALRAFTARAVRTPC